MPARRFLRNDSYKRKQLLKNYDKYVTNLSDYIPNSAEKTLLCRGLTFCPTPLNIDEIELQRDVLLFDRRIRLKHFFNSQQTQNTKDPFSTPSGWTPPPGKSPHLDAFLTMIQQDVTYSNPNLICHQKNIPSHCFIKKQQEHNN